MAEGNRRRRDLDADPRATKQARDVLETLSVHEWDTASLCDGWRVRDVVAHLIQTHLVTPRSLIADWIRSDFSLKSRNTRGVVRRSSLSPSELLNRVPEELPAWAADVLARRSGYSRRGHSPPSRPPR